MDGVRWWATAVGVLIVVGYAIGSGYWVQTTGDWYLALRRPAWQPPDVVFGLIWPYNFVMLAVAAYVLPQRLQPGLVVTWLCVFAASVITALLWAQQFYGPHHLVAAAAWLIATAALTLPVLVIAWRASAVIGALLVPYQVWIVLAASLSTAYARLNA